MKLASISKFSPNICSNPPLIENLISITAIGTPLSRNYRDTTPDSPSGQISVNYIEKLIFFWLVAFWRQLPVARVDFFTAVIHTRQAAAGPAESRIKDRVQAIVSVEARPSLSVTVNSNSYNPCTRLFTCVEEVLGDDKVFAAGPNIFAQL